MCVSVTGSSDAVRRSLSAALRRRCSTAASSARAQILLIVGEDREEAVADELEHMATVRLDRLDLRFRVVVA